MTVCVRCGELLTFLQSRGWVHARGLGIYTMTCRSCGFRASPYPSPVACPQCGSTQEWVDDHAAMPLRDTGEEP